jgi:hypothetical protein
MNKHRIFLGGGIGDSSIEEHNGWRLKFESLIEDIDMKHKILVFNPVSHISEFSPFRMNYKQTIDYHLDMLRKSDLMIMNFNLPNSVSAACELGIAYERRIPILGLNKNDYDLHPWLKNMCEVVFTDWDWMINYFVEHYFNEW